MSYIHKALKKAQKEKEARHNKYNSIVSTPGYKPRLFSGKALWLTCFFLVSLAFAAYFLLPFRSTQPPIREPVRHKVTPQPQATPQAKAPQQPEATPQPQSEVNATALYEKARDFHKRGRLQEAMRLYEKTLSLDPDYVDALNNLGVIHIHNRRYPAARASFAKAIKLRPDYVDSHYNLACLHALEGAVSQSLVHLKKAVSLDQSVKGWARRDADLKNLRGVPGFEEIIGRGGE